MKLKQIFITNSIFMVGMLALSAWAWRQLPPNAQIPTRFDLSGSPITYMGKEALLICPLMIFLIIITDLVQLKIEPDKCNLRRSSKAYIAVSIATAAFFASVHIIIILTGLGKSIDVATAINIILGLFLIVIGNYLSKIRRNHSFGVRTRWTVSSKLAWRRTHRLGGWLLVANGFAFLVAGWQSNTVLLIGSIIGLLIISIVILPIYSYLVWKADSNRL